MRRQPLLSFLVLLALWAFGAPARADAPTLAGQWNATAMRSDWNIGQWGQACGPSPTGGGAAGGSVTISSTGNELHLSGAGRQYSTTECWEQYPGLSLVSHSGGPRGWRNICKTKPADPRQATVVTTISATDTSISFDETGQYQFIIDGQNCTASARRTQTLLLVRREGDSAPAPVASTTRPCETLGAPERLDVRPARKLMRPGESFEFHSMVLDGAGCPLALSPVWKVLTERAALELSGPGKIQVASDAAESTVELQATVPGRSTRVTVEIASQERYDALLGQKGLNAEGESSDVATARLATTSIGAGSVVSRDDAQRRRVLFVGVVGGTAIVLGLLGFALVQRNRRKPVLPERLAPRVRLGPALTPSRVPPLAKICPTCREEYLPEAVFCPNDGNRLVATHGNAEPAGPSGGICPVCGQGYDPGVSTCPKHGEELLPAAVRGSVRVTDIAVTKKICPMCGRQYTGDSQFCGGCGAALVPVN